jgi:ribosome-binding protein aMBF1 (putative translation factor)
MIKNERQYRITKAQAQRFDQALKTVLAEISGAPLPKLKRAEVNAMQSALADLRRDLKEYESLRTERRRVIALNAIEDLPGVLIQARIASGLTQEQLASRLGVKPQQVQRYEATNYRSASLERVNATLRARGVKLQHRAVLRLVS